MRTVSFLLFPRTDVSSIFHIVKLTNDGISSIQKISLISRRAAGQCDGGNKPEKTQSLHGVGVEDGNTVVIGRALVNHQSVGSMGWISFHGLEDMQPSALTIAFVARWRSRWSHLGQPGSVSANSLDNGIRRWW